MTTLKKMEVNFPPELEAKLQEMVTETGRGTQLRGMLESRYDEIKSGKIQSIDGEVVFAQLRRMSADRRASLK